MPPDDLDLKLAAVDEADLPDLSALYADVFGGPPWNESWPVAIAQTRLSEILRTPGFYFLIARSRDTCLGFVLGFSETYNDGVDFYIKEMCVSTSVQRLGLGTALLTDLERHIAATGARKMYLLTARDTSAESFYAQRGYYVSDKMVMMGHWLRPA